MADMINGTMRERNMKKVSAADKTGKVIAKILVYIFLLIMSFVVLFPFYWMVISSLKTIDEYYLNVPTVFPKTIVWRNYLDALSTANLLTLFKNTVIVGIVSTLLSLVVTIISAFAFARLEFKGKNALFAALLATMMIPGELFTITNYATVKNFGWILESKSTGTNYSLSWLGEMGPYVVLIVPFLVSVFYIYLLRQNFMQIPNELYLAAKVDGTSDFKYLCKVMIPLALPTIISITIMKMMGAWNSYMWPNLVTNVDKYDLITSGLRGADFSVGERTNYPVQMAAVALVSIPLFLVFVFFRKYIMKGVSRSGIKG